MHHLKYFTTKDWVEKNAQLTITIHSQVFSADISNSATRFPDKISAKFRIRFH